MCVIYRGTVIIKILLLHMYPILVTEGFCRWYIVTWYEVTKIDVVSLQENIIYENKRSCPVRISHLLKSWVNMTKDSKITVSLYHSI